MLISLHKTQHRTTSISVATQTPCFLPHISKGENPLCSRRVLVPWMTARDRCHLKPFKLLALAPGEQIICLQNWTYFCSSETILKACESPHRVCCVVRSAPCCPGSPSLVFLEAPLGAGHAPVGFEWRGVLFSEAAFHTGPDRQTECVRSQQHPFARKELMCWFILSHQPDVPHNPVLTKAWLRKPPFLSHGGDKRQKHQSYHTGKS